MSLSISTFLLALNLVSSHSPPQSYSLASNTPVRQFELDDTFQGSHMVVFCVLRRHQAQIQALSLIDSGALDMHLWIRILRTNIHFLYINSNIHADYLSLMDNLLEQAILPMLPKPL